MDELVKLTMEMKKLGVRSFRYESDTGEKLELTFDAVEAGIAPKRPSEKPQDQLDELDEWSP